MNVKATMTKLRDSVQSQLAILQEAEKYLAKANASDAAVLLYELADEAEVSMNTANELGTELE